MFTKRIIPCLDVNAGRVVKGVNFVDLWLIWCGKLQNVYLFHLQ